MNVVRRHGSLTANLKALDASQSTFMVKHDGPQISVETTFPLVHPMCQGMGGSITSGGTMPGLTVELPDQHQCILNSTRQETWLLGGAWDDTNTTHVEMFLDLYVGLSRTVQGDVRKYINIAPDFNLHFFICTPTVYWFDDDNFGQPRYA